MRRSHASLVCALLGALTLTAGGRLATANEPADNPDLVAARAAIDELDFEIARSRLEDALRWGRNSPSQMAALWRLTGEVQAALGDEQAAEEHFFLMLTLDPTAELPTGVSPKLATPFARAKQRIATTGGLRGRCQLAPNASAVTVHIDADPGQQVVGARAIYRMPTTGTTQTAEARGREAITLALPAVTGLQLQCALIDRHGNRLLTLDSTTAPRPLADPGALGASRPDMSHRGATDSQSLVAHWASWSALAAASAAAAGYMSLRVRADEAALRDLNAASADHDFSEAAAIADRGRRNALMANLGFAVAGACATVAIVQFVRRPRGRRVGERTSLIAPAPIAGGATLTWTRSF